MEVVFVLDVSVEAAGEFVSGFAIELFGECPVDVQPVAGVDD